MGRPFGRRIFRGSSNAAGGGYLKRRRYSDEQIAFALRQAENGNTVEKICRKLGVSELSERMRAPTYVDFRT
jgi:putative transposase